MLTPQTSTIIATTGTKGKTSVTRAIHNVIDTLESVDVLRVDTNSVYVGKQRMFGLDASRNNAGYVPSVAPGRFLALLHDQPDQIAVLEASIGCFRAGLGYQRHMIGIFTNVFEDHIGTADYLKDQNDLANAKAAFIFGSIKKGGAAVYNADDPLVLERAEEIDPTRNIIKIACTLKGTKVDASVVMALSGGMIVLRQNGEQRSCLSIADTPWLLNGKHEPTLYNALLVVGALWFLYRHDEEEFIRALEVLRAYTPEAGGGRMVMREAQNDTKVILDYAHEKQSMKHVALFARSQAGPTGKVIGVLRLDSSRPSEHTRETGRFVAPFYDTVIVYDKDITRGNESSYSEATSAFYDGIRDKLKNVELVDTDTTALEQAGRLAGPHDVIVYIISSYAHSFDKAASILQFKSLTSKESL